MRPSWLFSAAGDAVSAGAEPLVCSEFGNWGLPQVDQLTDAKGHEPWWFQTGHDWAEGVMHAAGVQNRFLDWGLDRVFGSLAGFELGWIYYVARATAFAANLNVLISYLSRWWAGAEDGLLRILLMLAATAGLAFINIRGISPAMRVLGGSCCPASCPCWTRSNSA